MALRVNGGAVYVSSGVVPFLSSLSSLSPRSDQRCSAVTEAKTRGSPRAEFNDLSFFSIGDGGEEKQNVRMGWHKLENLILDHQ